MKRWAVLIEPQAGAEARAAYLWYAARNPRAAEDFQAEFEEAVGNISENPLAYPEFEPRTR